MACKYVKDFEFSEPAGFSGSSGKVMVKGYARGGKTASCGGSRYKEGGEVNKTDIKQDKAVIKTAVHKHEKSMHKGEPLTKLKKGGSVVEKATGERYPSRKAMMKHEREETPTMQREEVMERETVRRADRGPSGGPGMRPDRGVLGIIANKNPGERRGVPVAPNTPMISPMKKGGAVPKSGQHKIGKVMGEFKKGDLHSGSKTGPEVTNRKQAMAIALSEARNAGRKRK